jgi:hypothetical protein
MNQIISLLNNKKLKIFNHSESLTESRNNAESLLKHNTKHEITAALDNYHNTLIEKLKRDIIKAQEK